MKPKDSFTRYFVNNFIFEFKTFLSLNLSSAVANNSVEIEFKDFIINWSIQVQIESEARLSSKPFEAKLELNFPQMKFQKYFCRTFKTKEVSVVVNIFGWHL